MVLWITHIKKMNDSIKKQLVDKIFNDDKFINDVIDDINKNINIPMLSENTEKYIFHTIFKIIKNRARRSI